MLLVLFSTQTRSAYAATDDPFVPPNFCTPHFPDKRFDVMDYGAKGDGKVNDTAAINRAIAACNAAGGGTLLFPPGTYAAASIHLQSNVRLKLDDHARVELFAKRFDRYRCVLFDDQTLLERRNGSWQHHEPNAIQCLGDTGNVMEFEL